MRIRWVIAALSALALALLTLNVDFPGSLRHLMRPASTPGTGKCPANAKPANLNFTLKDIDHKEIHLADLKGKVVLLDFWATWCGPCKIEIPWFIEFQKRYGKDGLQVVGVSVDDTPDKLRPYVLDLKMNYPVLLGLDRDDVQDAYGPMLGIPVSVLISRDGKVCGRHTGLAAKDRFEYEIKSLL
jgi:cytochrome c biogenesis protein CcmG/thiol:disulfide interchange protein DsbE